MEVTREQLAQCRAKADDVGQILLPQRDAAIGKAVLAQPVHRRLSRRQPLAAGVRLAVPAERVLGNGGEDLFDQAECGHDTTIRINWCCPRGASLLLHRGSLTSEGADRAVAAAGRVPTMSIRHAPRPCRAR
jgi:hypothetical protein